MQDIHVFSIYPVKDEENDFYQFFKAIDNAITTKLIWWIQYLDCTGFESQEFCQKVTIKDGLIVSEEDLQREIVKFGQVLEGVFIGLENPIKSTRFNIVDFPSLLSPLAIEIIDGSYFDVYVKGNKLKKFIETTFPKVTRYDVESFFAKRINTR